MKRRVSLKDIADEVGVSISLVSYVVNNREKEGRVGKEMVKKIRAVAERLNYQPNMIAKGLKNNESRTIGLILADVSNPFFSNLARIIEDEASRHGYTVIIGSSDENSDKMGRLLDILSSRQVDGFIIVPTLGSEAKIELLIKEQSPFVLVDRNLGGLSCNCVMTDNFNASRIGVEHLLSKNYKKIGVLAYDSNLTHYLDRVKGYKHALAGANIAVDEDLIKYVHHHKLEEEVDKAIENLLTTGQVEAIFLTTNTLSLRGLKKLYTLGINVPMDVDILAFDQNEVFNFFEKKITHIVQPISKIGQQAVKVLLEQIRDETNVTNSWFLDGQLIINVDE